MHLLAANGASVIMDSPSRALVSAIPGDTLMRLPSVPEDNDNDFEDNDNDGAAEVGDGKFIFTNSVDEVKSYFDLSVPTLMGMLKNASHHSRSLSAARRSGWRSARRSTRPRTRHSRPRAARPCHRGHVRCGLGV